MLWALPFILLVPWNLLMQSVMDLAGSKSFGMQDGRALSDVGGMQAPVNGVSSQTQINGGTSQTQFNGGTGQFAESATTISPIPWPILEEGAEGKEPSEADIAQAIAMAGMMLLIPLSIFALYLIGGLVFAVQYKQKVNDLRPPFPQPPEVAAKGITLDTFNFFGCFDDCDTFLYSWCCMACRVADSWSTARVMKWWTTIAMFVLIPFGAQIFVHFLAIIEASIGHLIGLSPSTTLQIEAVTRQWVPVLLAGFAYGTMRLKLRHAFGEPNDNPLKHYCIWAFCQLCATIQEAKAVDAANNNAKVTCCCKVEFSEAGPLLGQPMQVVQGTVVQGNGIQR